jgi:sec-independent protein translocase protein TatB
MFGIDFSEILVIFGIALVVLGPEKLPRLARTIGRWVGRARAMARQFREQLEQEADALQRSVDLRTPSSTSSRSPGATPQPAPPAATIVPAAAASPDTPYPAYKPQPPLSTAEAAEHLEQPAPPPAEPHERAG